MSQDDRDTSPGYLSNKILKLLGVTELDRCRKATITLEANCFIMIEVEYYCFDIVDEVTNDIGIELRKYKLVLDED